MVVVVINVVVVVINVVFVVINVVFVVINVVFVVRNVAFVVRNVVFVVRNVVFVVENIPGMHFRPISLHSFLSLYNPSFPSFHIIFPLHLLHTFFLLHSFHTFLPLHPSHTSSPLHPFLLQTSFSSGGCLELKRVPLLRGLQVSRPPTLLHSSFYLIQTLFYLPIIFPLTYPSILLLS